MSAPRAVGVRAPYSAVPERVRAWVDETLGSLVVETAEQTGGMSPGCATRLVCADGSRAFVKAVGPELNPTSPELYRREITALGLLGSDPLWADLLASYDGHDGWVALVLEDVEGTHPDLSDDATMAKLMTDTDRLSATVAARVPDPPAPDPRNGGLDDLSAVFLRWAGAFDQIEGVPAELVPDWVRADAPAWQRSVQALATFDEPRLVHWDIRNDNLIQRASGEIVFLDWGAASVGPAWVDPLLARLERVEEPWFDTSLASSPALAAVGDDAVTAWLLGFGTFLAHRVQTAVDINLPTLNAFRTTESRRVFTAAARRLGMPNGS